MDGLDKGPCRVFANCPVVVPSNCTFSCIREGGRMWKVLVRLKQRLSLNKIFWLKPNFLRVEAAQLSSTRGATWNILFSLIEHWERDCDAKNKFIVSGIMTFKFIIFSTADFSWPYFHVFRYFLFHCSISYLTSNSKAPFILLLSMFIV